jgi:hypothetical protein
MENPLKRNLNLVPHDLAFGEPATFPDNGTAKEGALIEVIFRDLESRLIQEIQKYAAVFGCVAWLTNFLILDALMEKLAVSIVVQKEDFLRNDSLKGAGEFKRDLREAYRNLYGIDRFDIFNDETILAKYSYGSDTNVDAVRCVGNYNAEKAPAFPRMHNKFIVLCDIEKERTEQHEYSPFQTTIIKYIPRAVWSGSFNFTKNATYSFENAVLIKDNEIATAYLKEYAHIIGLSEPLDWESEWIAPEWRIGS